MGVCMCTWRVGTVGECRCVWRRVVGPVSPSISLALPLVFAFFPCLLFVLFSLSLPPSARARARLDFVSFLCFFLYSFCLCLPRCYFCPRARVPLFNPFPHRPRARAQPLFFLLYFCPSRFCFFDSIYSLTFLSLHRSLCFPISSSYARITNYFNLIYLSGRCTLMYIEVGDGVDA